MLPIIYGTVQGLTEFIPVSSSGHLLLLHEFLPLNNSIDEIAFDVSLHIGTVAALLIFFWKDVTLYLAAWFSSLRIIFQKRSTAWNAFTQSERLSWTLFVALIPAGLAGVFFESFIDTVLRSPWIVVLMLFVIGVVFFIVDQIAGRMTQRSFEQMTLGRGLFIGVLQIIALIPGTSRSGITIIAGMLTGLSRADSARFSFLMSAPLILAAGGKKGLDLFNASLTTNDVAVIALGAISAAVVGYIAIAGLLSYLTRKSLTVFAVYRIILAGIVAIILITR